MFFNQNTKRYIMVSIAVIMVNVSGQSTITLNVGNAKTVIPQEIFGTLMERLGKQWTGPNNSGIFVGTTSTIPNTDGMRNDVIEGFKDCGVGALEWPGGCAANNYEWQKNKKPSNDVGVNRFIEFCKATGAEAVIAGRPMAADSLGNLMFCQYIIDSLKYPLKYFKVGNEVWGCGGSQKVNTYLPNYTANYNKQKDYFAAKKVNSIACTDLIGNNGWLKTMLQNIGSTINGIEIHDYLYFPSDYSSVNPTDAQYWDVVKRANKGQIAPRIDELVQILDQYDPQNRVKIIEDEWGDWLKNINDKTTNEDGEWMQQSTIMDALSAAEQLHVFMQHADRIQVTCLAQGVNVIHSLMNINQNQTMVKTPTYYVYKMFKSHHCNNAKLVPIEESNYQDVNNVQAVTAFASVDDNHTVNISFTNVDMSNSRSVTATLIGGDYYYVKSAECVSSTEIKSHNDFGANEQVNIKTLDASNFSLSGKTLSVKLPAMSIVMIRLDPGCDCEAIQHHRNFLKNGADAFSIKAGDHGTVLISSSVSFTTPITISLYSADGRILIDKLTRASGSGSSILGNHIGRGIFLVKITGANINITKRVVITR